jgi:exopolyphosphatase / guanosine-5'-triphosphate,3'-diphosphate pyrophosphatase
VIRVAAIDCGTNSVRLLVADVDRVNRGLSEVERRTTITRLGQGVDRTGEFHPEALQRTFAVLEEYGHDLRRHRVHRSRFVATSAARDVSNREAFFEGVVERVGIVPEVVTGKEEAQLAYTGATYELESDPAVGAPIVVCDVGGGSTELVLRSPDNGSVVGRSMDVGSVRLTERHLRDDPPRPSQVEEAVADVDGALRVLDLALDDVGTLVGVAGSVTTIAAYALGLASYDRARIHLARLAADDVLRATEELLAMTVAERRELGIMPPGRADVIGGGAVVLATVLRHLGVRELLVSEHDILDGIAWSIA